MTTPAHSTPRVDVHLTADDLRAALRLDAEHGLRKNPKDIPPKWFYDDSRLAALRRDHARSRSTTRPGANGRSSRSTPNEIAKVTGADTLVELGSGTSEKTRILLDALRDAGTITRFVPFDVSEHTLRDAAAAVNRDYPSIDVHAVVGDFELHLGSIPRRRPPPRRVPRRHDRQPRASRTGGVPARGRRRCSAPDDYLLLGTRSRQGRRSPRSRVRRRAGRHRRVQQERLGGHEPRARRRLRRRPFEHVAVFDTDHE